MYWKSDRQFFFSWIFLLTTTASCYGQELSLQVSKKTCNYDDKYAGEKLILHYRIDTVTKESALDYWLEDFIELPDSSKLRLIGQLLGYENDTSLCCMNVVARSFNGIEGCGGVPKGITRYTIQVDALYIINRLCWPAAMELYSCAPVLYDNKLKREINSRPDKIKLIVQEYKKWYEQCKLDNKISDYFPFNNGRYVWYGGRKSGISKDNK